MKLSDEDRIRFRESSYEHIRSEMMTHIGFRRSTALAALVFSAATVVWLLTDGTEAFADRPYLIAVPWVVLVFGWLSTEATNQKIGAHIKFLRDVEESYEKDSKFSGFERHYEKEISHSAFPFMTSEKGWTRVILVGMGVLEAFLLFAKQ